MRLQSQLNSDRALAGVTIGFFLVVLGMRALFGVARWTREVFTTWAILGWIAAILVGAMAVLAVTRLASPDRTIPGSILAVVVLAYVPLHAAMWFGLVDVDTMFQVGRIAQRGFHPVLAVLGVAVLLWSLFRRRVTPTTA